MQIIASVFKVQAREVFERKQTGWSFGEKKKRKPAQGGVTDKQNRVWKAIEAEFSLIDNHKHWNSTGFGEKKSKKALTASQGQTLRDYHVFSL